MSLSRRQFLARIGATGVAAAGIAGAGAMLWQPRHRVPGLEAEAGPKVLRLPSFAVASSPGAPRLAIARGTDRAALLAAAIGELGGIGRFIQRGDVVLIKPNVGFDRPPAVGATSHPETVAALARLVLEAGADRVILADNPINSPAGCFLKSGLTKVANDLNLDILLPDESRFEPVMVGGAAIGEWSCFTRAFRGVTKVIGLAPAKDHNLCSASMTMKNWYGLLGGRRNQFHQKIHEVVADFALMIEPTLVILDGTRVLMRNGPTGGRPSDVKPMDTIVAGTDMVAVDAFGAAELLGRDLARIKYLSMATERGLGTMDWKSLNPREVQV